MRSDGVMNIYFYREVDNEKIFGLNSEIDALEQELRSTHEDEVDEIISKIRSLEKEVQRASKSVRVSPYRVRFKSEGDVARFLSILSDYTDQMGYTIHQALWRVRYPMVSNDKLEEPEKREDPRPLFPWTWELYGESVD